MERQNDSWYKILFSCVVFISLLGTVGAETADPNHYNHLFDMSIEDLMSIEVQSAGFFTTTTTKAPGSVMVYNMDKIRDGSARTLADLLELYVPGVIIGGHERQGRLIGTRGLLIDNNAKTLVMWDGQQINYRSHFGYMIGLVSPFMGDIDRVEVIHGPGAIQHGSGAISGFINMVPRTGSSHPGLFANYEYGFTEQSNLFEAGYGLKYGENRDLYVYGGSYHALGFEPDQDYGSPKSYSGDVDAFGYKKENYRVSTTWRHDQFSLNWFIYSLAPQKNNSNQETGFFMNQTMGIRPKYVLEFTDTESLELNGSFLWGDFGDTGCNGYTAGMQGGSERHWEFKPIFKTTRFENHLLALGGSYGYKQFRNAEFYFTHDPRQGTESIDTHWYEKSLFAEDIISITDKLTLSLGIRYDEYVTESYLPSLGTNPTSFKPDQMDGHISPRVALAYEVDKQTNVKASYQHGFRMPDAAYYNWNSFNNNAANALGFSQSPALEPETMDSWELDLQKKWTDKLETGLNLFYNTFTDQLSWGALENYWTPTQVNNPGGPVDSINEWTDVTWGGGMFQNVSGSYHIWGFETPVTYALADNTDLNVSYGFSETIDNQDHNIKQKYPFHQVKVNLTSRFLEDRLSVGVNYVYNSSYTDDMYYPTGGDSLNSHYKNPRNLVDLSMAYKVNKNLKIKGVVKNLFGDQTPPSNNRMNVPNWGNVGYDETRFYLSAEMTF